MARERRGPVRKLERGGYQTEMKEEFLLTCTRW
jgi:hypothetical protein